MVPRRSWIVVAVLGVVGCAGGDAPVDVSGHAQGALTVTPHYDGLAPSLPASIHGVFTLDIAADGAVTGLIGMLGAPAMLEEVSGRFADGVVTLEPGRVGVTFWSSLGWDDLTIRAGGVGRLDTGTGAAVGTMTYGTTDVVESIAYTAELTTTPDLDGEPVGLAQYPTKVFAKVLPFDEVEILLGEPAAASAAAQVRVVAGGAAVAGSLTPFSQGGMVTSLVFQPQAFLPFGATLSVDPNGLADPSGNLMAPGPQLETVADPGPASPNLGFERGLAGWIAQGREVGTSGAIYGVAPAEGAGQLLVREGSAAAGYLDVAADATSLSLSVAVVGSPDDLTDYSEAKVALHRRGGEDIVVFDLRAEAASAAPCSCAPEFTVQVGPVTKTVDLTPYRGERLFLTAGSTSGRISGLPLAMLLDAVRVE